MIKSRTKDMKITEVLHRMEQYKQEFIDFLTMLFHKLM